MFADSFVSRDSSFHSFPPTNEIPFSPKVLVRGLGEFTGCSFLSSCWLFLKTNISFTNLRLRLYCFLNISVTSTCKSLMRTVTTLSFSNNVSKAETSSLYAIRKGFQGDFYLIIEASFTAHPFQKAIVTL